jgi:lipocalin-like protein
MKKVLLSILSFAILSVAFVACNKDDDNNNNQKTKTELITQSTWKFDHATASGFGDVSAQLPACRKDNVITLSSNGSGSIDEGPTKCNAGDPQTTAITWSFLNNETTLHLSSALFTGGSTDFTIVSLTETNLVISQTMTIAPYPATTVEITFKH